ncbi:MarR family winged helix-turn-helix transcriptional regulator [Modestobacter lapidis]|nr:winged helix-turn-helix transcriptional regulator [Modestobacter lapidis]
MQITPATSHRLTAGVTQLVRAGRRLGSRVADDLYGDLPSFGWAVLVPLEQDGPQRCSALAARLGVDVSVASRQVSALERAGYLDRRPDPHDGRASLVSLSAAGAAALARTREVRGTWVAAALHDWTDEEARELTARLERLTGALEAARRPVPRPSTPVAG